MRKRLRWLAGLAGVGLALLVMAGPAMASGSITSPTTNPFTVPNDASGNPASFTISFSGYPANGNVNVEQCDGVSPTSPGWDPTIHCDSGTSPAPVIADASGNGSFPANDPNHGFTPFRGASPSGMFDCLAPGQAPTGDGLPSFTNCQVRVTLNDAAVTSSDNYFTLTLQAPGAATPETAHAILLPIIAVVLLVGASAAVITRRRRVFHPTA